MWPVCDLLQGLLFQVVHDVPNIKRITHNYVIITPIILILHMHNGGYTL